jgi:hypothetical protein
MESWVLELLKQTGALGVMVLLLWWQRGDNRDRLAAERQDKLDLGRVVSENTRAWTEMIVLVRGLSEKGD